VEVSVAAAAAVAEQYFLSEYLKSNFRFRRRSEDSPLATEVTKMVGRLEQIE
jgi:hypothetical protein